MDMELQKNKENKGLIAIANTLARAKDGMSMQEKKLMAIYLSKIEWKNVKNNLEIWVDKREIMELLESKIDSTDQSAYLRKLAQDTVHHSDLHFDGEDKDEWEDMPLFTRRKSTRNQLMMELYHGAADLIQGLEKEYITLFLRDILRFDSNIDGLRAYTLYEYLRLHSDTRRINSRIISTKEFKELFNIPKDGKGSYMQYDAKKGKDVFNRTNFEKYVIEPVLKMVARCEHVVLHNFGKDKKGEPVYYTKIKKNGLVQGYELIYTINKYPSVTKRETIVDEPKKTDPAQVPKSDQLEGQMGFTDLASQEKYMREAELADDFETNDIKTIAQMMAQQGIELLEAKKIYDAAKGDVQHITRVYNHFKDKGADKSFVGLMIKMVQPGVFQEPKKAAKKTGFHNFEERNYSAEYWEELEKALTSNYEED